MPAVLRRSLLYVPASAESMVRKVGGRGADVVILDLEDGVHASAKDRARAAVSELVREVDFGSSEVFVRVNALSSPWAAEDLAAVPPAGVAAVVVPKVSTPEDVRRAESLLGRPDLPLFAMVESAAAVLAAPAIARSSARLAGLCFGSADYRESLGAGRDPDEAELLFARSQILHAARAARLEAYDAPFFDYRDLPGLERSAARVRTMGFDGKAAIHPSQVGVIRKAFTPDSAEVEWARRVIRAAEEASERGRAVAGIHGEMIEAVHERIARRILARAESP
jgi:citrate lyase subunit beta/citryl-CoA lyase